MSRLEGLEQVPVFVEPGDAKVTTEFGKNIKDYPTAGKTGDHNGIDIVRCTDGKNSLPATICAVADGEVCAHRKWVKGFRQDSATGGNCVHIRHKDGTVSKYMHLKYGSIPDWVAVGAEVKKGQTVGYMGDTGLAYGVHLHFQIEDENGKPIDPEPYLLGKKIPCDGRYEVVAGTFDSEDEAAAVSQALKTLGLDSVYRKTR